jgi:hypothetical protein
VSATPGSRVPTVLVTMLVALAGVAVIAGVIGLAWVFFR